MWLSYLNTKAKANGGALSYATICSYRWAAHAAHTDMDMQSPFGDSALVQLMMRAIRKVRAAEGDAVMERLPVTRAALEKVMPLINVNCFDDVMFAAAMWVATTGMFRPGELGAESANSKQRLLTISSLRTVGTRTYIHLSESKGDTKREGVDVEIRSQRACHMLDAYLALRPSAQPHEPLFAWSSGQPMLHSQLVDLTTDLLVTAGVPFMMPDGSPCRGVSFRKGGASDLANTGVSDKAIQVMGRWRSFCSLRYIHPTNALMDAAAIAADSTTDTSTPPVTRR
jgi:hypothetical protein